MHLIFLVWHPDNGPLSNLKGHKPRSTYIFLLRTKGHVLRSCAPRSPELLLARLMFLSWHPGNAASSNLKGHAPRACLRVAV